MNVIAYDPFLTIHTPLLKETRYLIDE